MWELLKKILIGTPPQPKQEEKFELPPVKHDPKVSVEGITFENNDPRQGTLELDWNPEFVQWLRENGYPGQNDEQVVDIWLQDLCKHIALETWEQYDADPTNRNYIQTEDIGNGRKSVS